MKGNLTLALWLLALVPGLMGAKRAAAAAEVPEKRTATVQVLAFRTLGGYLSKSPTIERFESRDRKNFASRFHNGVAEGIPFGDYLMVASVFPLEPERRLVRIYQAQVMVVIGPAVRGIDFREDQFDLHGRVVDPLLVGKRSFVKLVGVFSAASLETSISDSGVFEFGGLTWGKYLLLVISEDGIVATRPISIPYSMNEPPLEIAVGSGNPPSR